MTPMREFGRTLEAAQRGDEEAFADLWRRFQPGLLRYLKVKATPVAEDIAADVWLRVMTALRTFEGDDQQFKAWLYTTARNRVTDWYRSGQRRLESTGLPQLVQIQAGNDVEFEVDQRAATDAAITLIRQLPPSQAEAVMLRVVAGLDVRRVATVMGRSPGSVRVLCHRGLKMVERLLEEAGSTLASTDPESTVAAEVSSTMESA